MINEEVGKKKIQISIKLNKLIFKTQHDLSVGLSVNFIQGLLKVRPPLLLLVSHLSVGNEPERKPEVELL